MRETAEPTTFPVTLDGDGLGVYEYTAEGLPAIGNIIDVDDAQRRPRTVRARVVQVESEAPHAIRAAELDR